MRVDDFDYALPPELIAQYPPAERDGGRLMVLDRASGEIAHHAIRELPELLDPGTLMVVNDSRVIWARLRARRATGGRVELLLLERLEIQGAAERWSCMLRSSKSPRVGEVLALEQRRTGGPRPRRRPSPLPQGQVTVLTPPAEGRCEVALAAGTLELSGSVPLPPYIRRVDEPGDRERYQTVYARPEGSVAAPTAGLHLTRPLLQRLRGAGVELGHVTLHVGPGTFQPVRCQEVELHEMERERYAVPERTARAIRRARAEKRPVLAVGTTVVRTLEATGGRAGSGRTGLFIYPGHRFGVVDRLLTNFHLPRSTLVMLVAAFAGAERLLGAYAEAVRQGYRFYSYGDAMYIR
jgi:S-adenosylmethionine:tRNA ribosyltransferase-isomerase